MLLERNKQVECLGNAVRRHTVYRGGRRTVADPETELLQIEQAIKDITDKTRSLADELGARYAVFRCSARRYDDSRDIRRAGLIDLSRETDEYIQAIYILEQRRKELLGQIGKSIG
jgi:hypothetical protein